MRTPPWSVGLLMILMGGMSLSGFDPHRTRGVAAYVLGGLLIAGGAGLFLPRRTTFFFALGASLLLALSGVADRFGHREFSLPVPWWMAVVVGLYLCVRVPMAQFQAPRNRRKRGEED